MLHKSIEQDHKQCLECGDGSGIQCGCFREWVSTTPIIRLQVRFIEGVVALLENTRVCCPISKSGSSDLIDEIDMDGVNIYHLVLTISGLLGGNSESDKYCLTVLQNNWKHPFILNI